MILKKYAQDIARAFTRWGLWQGGGGATVNLSHVGMIIHSATLDTEEKVKEIYGGESWTKIEGRFLLGQSSRHTINTTGGEETHKLTVAEMPSHNHDTVPSKATQTLTFATNGFTTPVLNTTSVNVTNPKTGSAGGGQSHNNMPPYEVVYIWKRIA